MRKILSLFTVLLSTLLIFSPEAVQASQSQSPFPSKTRKGISPLQGQRHTNLGSANAVVAFVSHMQCEKCVVEFTRIDNIIAGLNGRPYKLMKAQGLLTCMLINWRNIAECKNYNDQYPYILTHNLVQGWLGPKFVCQAFFKTCTEYDDIVAHGWSTLYEMNPLQEYFLKFSYPYKSQIDDLYTQYAISGDSSQTFQIMHLNDLFIDPLYVTGSSSDCYGFVCCHADSTGQIPENIPKDDVAGIFGHTKCDMPLNGALEILKEIKINMGQDPAILVVSGIVSLQKGQLTSTQQLDEIKEMFTKIKEIFPNSLLVPVLGPSDLYPQAFNPFSLDIATENIKLNPFTYKNEQQAEIDAQDYLTELVAYINSDVLPTEKTGDSTEMSLYDLSYILDEPLIYRDGVQSALTGTILGIVNMQACNSANFALFSTFNDPGDQLTNMETTLSTLRSSGKKAILVGAGRAPGDSLCNRQWSYRFLSLMDEYQDVVRLVLIGGDKDGFQVMNGIQDLHPLNVAQITGQFSSRNAIGSYRLYTMSTEMSLPTQIDVYQLLDINSATTVTDINIENVRSYPNDVSSMADLSPSSYFAYTQQMIDDESEAVVYKSIQSLQEETSWWRTILDNPSTCDSGCRKQLSCKSAYSVNEQVIECFEMLFDLQYTIQYFVGIYQNPWFSEVLAVDESSSTSASHSSARLLEERGNEDWDF